MPRGITARFGVAPMSLCHTVRLRLGFMVRMSLVVLDMFFAGEPIDVVASEYGVTREQVEAAVRVAGRAVAGGSRSVDRGLSDLG